MPSCPPPMTSVYGCVAHPSFFASRSRFCVHVSRSRLAPCSAPSLPGLSTWGPSSREDPKSIDPPPALGLRPTGTRLPRPETRDASHIARAGVGRMRRGCLRLQWSLATRLPRPPSKDGVSDPGAVSCWEGRFRAAILDAEAPSHRAGGLKNCLVRGSGEGGPYVLALEHTSNSLPMRSPNPEGTDLAVHQKLREGLDDRLEQRASLSQASR